MFFILAYVSPIILVLMFFLASYFLLETAGKLILFLFLVWIIVLPFILLYKEEVVEYRKQRES